MSTQSSVVTILALALALLLSLHQCSSLPLSTNGRFIVDAASGQRVKLHCVNWPAHMQAVLPEGLSERPVAEIASLVASLGFNCVRLTYATFTWTEDDKYANLTVEGSLRSLGLMDAVEGVRRNNPSLMGLMVRDAYEKVVDALGDAGVMVVLDNHVSFPMWCCADNDGNGFFGDKYFDPQVWMNGLHNVAQRFNGKSQVVGMSMRNELRGPHQNVMAWYNYVQQGAATIHTTNPNVLVIISGLKFDTDLSFLESKPLPSNFDHKLVHEAHWYSFGKTHQWETQNPGDVCANDTNAFDQKAGFLIRPGVGRESVPLFVSEFGVDQRGVNVADNRYLSCLLAYVAENDLDWALWALQGSYYIRDGKPGEEETYGVLDARWARPRNSPLILDRLRLIKQTLQVPPPSPVALRHRGNHHKNYKKENHILYHPLSGMCVSADEGRQNVVLSDCSKSSRWFHRRGGQAIMLSGADHLCMHFVGEGQPVTLSTQCNDQLSSWWSVAMFQFGSGSQGKRMCLDGGNSQPGSTGGVVTTTECDCLGTETCQENPQTQWFTFVTTNV